MNGCGFQVAVIDAPSHGDGPRAAGEPEGPIVARYNAHLAELAVPEWRSTLDALQQLPEIGTDGPVGYSGLNLGTAIGVPFLAPEPRITARLALFNAFVSTEKTLPVNAGKHKDLPRFEAASAVRFCARQLIPAA